ALDTNSDQSDLAKGTRPELSVIGVPTRVGGGQLKPSTGDLEVRAGWGHGSSVVMPGQGRVVTRPFTNRERGEILRGAKVLGVKQADCWSRLGDEANDVYLNDVAYWENVPSQVWEFYLGGYQVLKKWLSYREFSILGRPLEPGEVHEFRKIVWRLTAIRLLEPELDRNYNRSSTRTFAWSAPKGSSAQPAIVAPTKGTFGGQVSFGKDGKMKGTASLKNWKKE
ncbi:MAG: hypothetical protein L3K10_08170, partial [Thermoplasmata archaeon]|nr:hypothetical protein [Thermoplasmata archaeon]